MTPPTSSLRLHRILLRLLITLALTAGFGTLTAAPARAATPGTPLNVQATSNAAGEITVTWTAPTDSGGSPITKYGIAILSGGTVWGQVQTPTPATSYKVTGLSSGGSYAFIVAANNGTWGEFSAPTQPVPATGGSVPSTPTGLTATAGDSSATFRWTAPASSLPITRYHVLVEVPAGSGAQWVGPFDTGDATTEISFDGLQNGDTYRLKVAATSSAGTGPYSAPSPPVTPTDPPSQYAPANLAGTPGNGQVALTWTAPQQNPETGAVVGYQVQTSSNGGGSWSAPISTGSTNTAYVVAGLTNGTAYHFRVAATFSQLGAGPWSAVLGPKTPTSGATQATTLTNTASPTTVTSGASTTVSTVLKSGSTPLQGKVVTLEKSTNGGSTWTTVTLPTTSSTGAASVTNAVTTTSQYRWKFAGGGGYAASTSPSVTVTVGSSNTVPAAPTKPTATPGNGQVTLNWTAPANGGSAIGLYVVQRSTDNGVTWTGTTNTPSAATSYTVTGLSNGTAYRFRVAAHNSVGTGSYSVASDSVTPTGSVSTVPNPPAKPTAVAGDQKVTLTWAEPVGYGSGTWVRWEIGDTAGGVIATITDKADRSHLFTGLTNGVSYQFKVRAVTTAGPGAWSPLSDAATPAAVPGTATGVATGAGIGLVKLPYSIKCVTHTAVVKLTSKAGKARSIVFKSDGLTLRKVSPVTPDSMVTLRNIPASTAALTAVIYLKTGGSVKAVRRYHEC